MLAGLLDAALLTVAAVAPAIVAARFGAVLGRRPQAAGRLAALAVLALVALRERGDSPGLRLAGLERRDRRSGRRPGTARAIAIVALSLVPRALSRWATATARERDRAARMPAIDEQRAKRAAVRARHPDDPAARARAEADEVGPPVMAVSARTIAGQLAVSWLVRRALAPLRRRLAGDPVTVVIGSPRAAAREPFAQGARGVI